MLRQNDFDTNANTHPVLYPVYRKKQYPKTWTKRTSHALPTVMVLTFKNTDI